MYGVRESCEVLREAFRLKVAKYPRAETVAGSAVLANQIVECRLPVAESIGQSLDPIPKTGFEVSRGDRPQPTFDGIPIKLLGLRGKLSQSLRECQHIGGTFGTRRLSGQPPYAALSTG
jgi:hypothetical protein